MIGKISEETLDSENWDEMRVLGHRMLDDMMTRLETIHDHKQDLHGRAEAAKKLLAPLSPDGEGEGKYTPRTCNVNHRSRKEDFYFLVDELKRIGEEQTQIIGGV